MDSFEKTAYETFLKEQEFNPAQIELCIRLRDSYLEQKDDSDFYYDDFTHDTAIELIHSGLFEKNDPDNWTGLYGRLTASDVIDFITEYES